MQLFRCCLGLRPVLHVQLVENVADVGLHGRQLHIHDLRDLGVGLVGAEQMENWQLRGRQLLTGGKAGFEEMRVERRLRPHRCLISRREEIILSILPEMSSPFSNLLSAPLCGKEMSSHASLPLACGILFLAVLYILFSSFFAYFLFPIHYNTNISGL